MPIAIPLTKEEIKREFKSVSGKLESLGLSAYESRAYIALVAHGYGNAELIAKTAQIPRTSAYSVLKSLEIKGFAIATSGRPVIYKPEPPSKIYERVRAELEETFQKLELIHEILRERGEPQLVYTITGKEKVTEKIGELLDKSTKNFIISTPVLSEVREKLGKNIQNALKRGVEVTVITEPLQKVPWEVRLFRRKGLIATDVISDGRNALIASPDLNACGYIENESLARHLKQFLEILMEH
ncbi:MAG: TrmB family transcriptional regulator [Methanomassiliicoccales archaeon]|nr:MAG: TrmB family transcriptional regulator [Methanomassiliicoccales archaeon]